MEIPQLLYSATDRPTPYLSSSRGIVGVLQLRVVNSDLLSSLA